ncbi:hypothetical protein JCM14076_00190 [Methylosoma difficile]
MHPDLELKIRKYYSDIYPQLSGLELWARNTFSELCLHEDHVYDFDIRIKAIESLLEKIDKKIIPKLEKNQTELSTDNIFKEIDDFLGVRIMTLVPGSLPILHNRLLNMSRLKEKLISIHYPDTQPHRINAFQLRKESERRSNLNGYFGIHYVFHPNPVDEFYEFSKERLFDRFELQLRTLMQHAWSEVQHKVIYKSNRPDYSLPLDAQFNQLAVFITSCDDCLSSLASIPIDVTPTRQIQLTESQSDFELINRIQDIIKIWEENDSPIDIRQKETIELEKENQEKINILLASTTTNDNLIQKSELAELYLKGGFLEKSYSIYKEIKKIGNKEGWICLRLAETCNKLLKNEEALENLTALKNYLEEKDLQEQQADLYMGAAMCSWSINRFDYAVFFSEKEITSTKQPKALVRGYINFIYYKLALLETSPTYDLIAEYELLNDKSDAALKICEDFDIELTPEKCDTLMYFYTSWSAQELHEGNTKKYEELIAIANKFMKQLYSKISSQNRLLKQCWKDHTVTLVALSANLNDS